MILFLLLFIARLCSPHELLNTDVCFTWNTVNQNLVLNCKVLNQIHEIAIAAPFNKSLVICNEKNQDCRGSGNFTKEKKANYTIIIVRTDMKSVDGEWTCRHGRSEKTVNVSFEHGFVHSVDITLYGEVMEINQRNTLKLVCFSCWTPVGKSVEFFVNGRIEDSVRESNGDCYHIEQLCSADKCACSPEGNNFTWTLPTDYSNINVSCEMIFVDEQMSTSSIRQASLFYDGKGIIETGEEKHIPNSRSDPTNDDNPIEKKEDNIAVIIGYISAGVCIMILIATIICCFVRCKMKKKENDDAPEETALTGVTENDDAPEETALTGVTGVDSCSTCTVLVVYSVCKQCQQLYCHQCSTAHFKTYSNHELCAIRPKRTFLTSKVRCKICERAIASAVCTKCKNVYCKKCTCSHGKKNLQPLLINSEEKSFKAYDQCLSTVTLLHQIEISPSEYKLEIRICGIASLPDFLVAADRCNKNLIVFQDDNFLFNTSLGDKEPRAISYLQNNNIAITMPYENKILLYEIKETGAENYKIITLEPRSIGKPIGRPYSITYDSNHLAVETGISDDGIILIIKENGTIVREISNKNHMGYFTGNTLRLALDWKKQRVYVSALSKKAVSCVDLDGNIKWGCDVPSPRDVITIEQENGQKLILSSKRTDTLYMIDPSRGVSQILFSEGSLSEPRFLAYNNQRKILYVNQGNRILLYELMLN